MRARQAHRGQDMRPATTCVSTPCVVHSFETELDTTRREAVSSADVVSLFLESARRCPDAPALSCGGITRSYTEVREAAGALAARLRAMGVTRETRVGICLDRSTDWPVAILGVLMAGGAYVPMDATLPDERIAYKMADSRVTVMVSTPACIARHTLPVGTALLLVDGAAPTPTGDLGAGVAPSAARDLAYVIYTSGSTGRPKGVAVERGSLAFSTAARMERYGVEPSAMLGVYPFSFDSSVAGLFWMLAVGGHYVIAASGEERDPHRLAKLIERHRIAYLDCLPSHYATVLDYASDAALQSVRLVVVGGEELTRSVWAQHRRRLPNVPLHNEYGPTEGTVWCCVHELGHPEHFGRVPIGMPLHGVDIRIESPDGSPVPPGTSGELLIGGPGLARGYLGDDDLTAQRFVMRDRPGPAGAQRFYRTGDLVRIAEDGLLEFLGRLDRQVKLNGYRIELGEVEAALAELPGARQVAATVIGNDDLRRLVAYAVVEQGASLTSTAMRRQLAVRLPPYMIPSMLVVLDRLPLTANGKVDYPALPDPVQASLRPTQPPGSAAGGADAQHALIGIWQRHLGHRNIKPTDNFFDLGGTSLMAIRAAAEARESLGHTIDPREFYFRTLEQLATTMAGDRS